MTHPTLKRLNDCSFVCVAWYVVIFTLLSHARRKTSILIKWDHLSETWNDALCTMFCWFHPYLIRPNYLVTILIVSLINIVTVILAYWLNLIFLSTIFFPFSFSFSFCLSLSLYLSFDLPAKCMYTYNLPTFNKNKIIVLTLPKLNRYWR